MKTLLTLMRLLQQKMDQQRLNLEKNRHNLFLLHQEIQKMDQQGLKEKEFIQDNIFFLTFYMDFIESFEQHHQNLSHQEGMISRQLEKLYQELNVLFLTREKYKNLLTQKQHQKNYAMIQREQKNLDESAINRYIEEI